MALLFRTPRDFDDGARGVFGECSSCGEWLVKYVPYCTVCKTPISLKGEEEEELISGQKSQGAVRIIHLSDLHLGRPLAKFKPLETFRIWLGAFEDTDADLIVVSGDLVQKSTDKRSYQAITSALEASSLPYVVVPGNHDTGTPGQAGLFEDLFGVYPRIEKHAGVNFILLDSNAGLPSKERRRHERLFARLVCFVEGRVGEEQIGKLDDIIGGIEDGPRVMVIHHHLVSQPDASRRFGLMEPLSDAHTVRRWADANNIRLVLHGHHHVMRRAGVQSGGLVVLNGGTSTLIGPPFRARMVDILPSGKLRIVPVELRV